MAETRAAPSPLPACRRARTLTNWPGNDRKPVARHQMWWDSDGITDLLSPVVAPEWNIPEHAPMILQVALLFVTMVYGAPYGTFRPFV